jgi:hypothetical protein
MSARCIEPKSAGIPLGLPVAGGHQHTMPAGHKKIVKKASSVRWSTGKD